MLRNFIRWFNPPKFEDDEKTRLAKILHSLLLITIFLIFLLLIFRALTFSLELNTLFTLGFLIIFFTCLWIFLKRGYVNVISSAVIIAGWLAITNLARGEGVRDTGVFAYFIAILIASLLLGWRASAIVTASSIIAIWYFSNLEIRGDFTPNLSPVNHNAIDITFIFLISAALIYLLDTGLRNAIRRARANENRLIQTNQELQEFQTDLEQRVAERTAELESANRKSQQRASQFEAIAQVARNISTSQNLETLLPKITNVISEHFGFYHVGIFLLGENREFAILRAANSPGGRKMLERAHQLKVGEIGIVGFVTSEGKPRIALDTGSDTIYFNNPDLPDTRSEMALPLVAGNQVIGALDVQSLEANAFSQEDISTLSTLADQVSIAIRNAMLFEETRHALAQSQALYQQFTQAGWRKYTRSQKLTGIQRSKARSTLLREHMPIDDLNGKSTLSLPITLRDQKIGSLKIRTDDHRQWSQDEVDIASAIIERAAIALESARLLDDAQRRATREHIIGEISASIGSSTDMEEIMRSAVQELGRRMGGAEVVLELGTDITENMEPDGSVQ